MNAERTKHDTAPCGIEAVRERVACIFEKELGIDLSEIDLDGDLRQQVYVDSMQLAEAYAAVVAELGIELPAAILAATTLREMFDIIHKELIRTNSEPGEPPA